MTHEVIVCIIKYTVILGTWTALLLFAIHSDMSDGTINVGFEEYTCDVGNHGMMFNEQKAAFENNRRQGQ